MAFEQPIVWDEGMLLVPQQFQQWDRAFRALVRDRFQALYPRGWGLTELEVDPESLRAGEFRLSKCAGVLRSGLPFQAPENMPLPAGRSVGSAFDPREASLKVYLAMPSERLGTPACSDGGNDTPAMSTSADGEATTAVPPTPWRRLVVSVLDANLPNSERDVPVAVPNLRILVEGDPVEEHDVIQVASVVQSSGGGYQLDPKFVPTCLHASASPRFMEVLQMTSEMLARRAEELMGEQRGTGGMAETATLVLRKSLNSHIPHLLHFLTDGKVHPEVVFLRLAELAAELCTLTTGDHPRDLPRYLHEDMTGCVARMEQELRRLLAGVIPNRCIQVPLQKPSETMFAAEIADASLLEGQFFLAVLADIDEQKLSAEFPAKAKITSRGLVQQLLMRAVPGLPARHVPNPPKDIPVQPGRQYFRLDKDGDHWDSILESRSFAMHVPPDFPGLRVDMMVVKED